MFLEQKFLAHLNFRPYNRSTCYPPFDELNVNLPSYHSPKATKTSNEKLLLLDEVCLFDLFYRIAMARRIESNSFIQYPFVLFFIFSSTTTNSDSNFRSLNVTLGTFFMGLQFLHNLEKK